MPEINELVLVYEQTGSIYKTAKLVNMKPQTVHYKLKNIGLVMDGTGKKWTEEDTKRLQSFYAKGFKHGDGQLDEFAESMGRTKQYISRKASQYGLTNKHRKMSAEEKQKNSQSTKDWHKNNTHPKGALGLRHTDETKAKLSKISKKMWSSMTEKQKSAHINKGLKTRHKNGTLIPPRNKVSWKQGWRSIGGKRNYYRSRWEANYARYLEYLKIRGDIKDWEHEPDTFWFEKIKRGTRSYLPDFKVTENNGDIIYHEVKGWMDDRSKTKLKRMKKYYPEVKLIVVDSKPYKEIQKKLGRMIDGWE